MTKKQRIPPDLRVAAELARKSGWTITITGSKHLCWRSPEGRPVYIGSTPSQVARATQNALAGLRRAGLEIPRRTS